MTAMHPEFHPHYQEIEVFLQWLILKDGLKQTVIAGRFQYAKHRDAPNTCEHRVRALRDFLERHDPQWLAWKDAN